MISIVIVFSSLHTSVAIAEEQRNGRWEVEPIRQVKRVVRWQHARVMLNWHSQRLVVSFFARDLFTRCSDNLVSWSDCAL